MNSEVEACIRENVPWTKLPSPVKQVGGGESSSYLEKPAVYVVVLFQQLGNSQKEYEKCVVTFSVKNQVRFRGNLVRQVRKDEKKYYGDLISYSRQSLMLFPYHLSDVIVKGLFLTPFQYYAQMMEALMAQERSYDSLPNFTAADCEEELLALLNKVASVTSKEAGYKFAR